MFPRLDAAPNLKIHFNPGLQNFTNDRKNNIRIEVTQCTQSILGSVPEVLAHSNWDGTVARSFKLWSTVHHCTQNKTMWFLTGLLHCKMSQLGF